MKTIALDARMIAHSGIGIALRGLLHGWVRNPPPFQILLLGPRDLLQRHAPDWMHRDWDASIYGASGFLPPPAHRDCDAWLAMHYPLPMGIRVPVAAVVHDVLHVTHADSAPQRLYARARLMHLRARASVVFTPSRHGKVQLQTLHRFPAHRVLFIPWGAGIAGWASPTHANPVGLPPRGYLLAIGIWKPHKNLAFLLERLALLVQHKKLEKPLVVAGLRPNDHAPVRELVARFGIPANALIILEHVTDEQLLAVLRDAAALVFPSLAEGFGFPLAEAIALGTPAIAMDLPPMNELSDQVHLVAPDDPDAFDAALIDAANGRLARPTPHQRPWTEASDAIADALVELMERKHH